MTIEKAVTSMCLVPGGWVGVNQLRGMRGGLEIGFGIRKGKRGRELEAWSVICKGIHEVKIDDLNGGGINVHSGHPAARQYVARQGRASLASGQRPRCNLSSAPRGALGRGG